jgi:glycerophosphoryl diester phosphodiesterase
MTKVDIAQLVSGSGAPYDQKSAGSPTTYDDMVTRSGLKQMSRYADWVAPTKTRVLPIDPQTGQTTQPTSLVRDAHRSGLQVVVWTLRAENQFMAANFRRGSDPNAFGDMSSETTAFLDAGVDAVFSDHPDIADDARDDWSSQRDRVTRR